MKAIVVEGQYDYQIILGIFPQIEGKIMLRPAHGFSSAFAMMKSLIDYGYDVMAVYDTDTDRPDNDNRRVLERIYPNELVGRSFRIVWMDSCIEDVLERAVPGFNQGIRKGDMVRVKAARNRLAILEMPEFQEIQRFIEDEG